MPNFNIVKKNTADKTSFRVQSIIGMFDLPNEHLQETFTGEINIDNADWNVGIIYGASGTGKSTIAKELFGENIFMDDKHEGLSVIDEMPKNKSVKDITKAFCACGFSSPPSWLKPYHVLSNGEKMRVDLAKQFCLKKIWSCLMSSPALSTAKSPKSAVSLFRKLFAAPVKNSSPFHVTMMLLTGWNPIGRYALIT